MKVTLEITGGLAPSVMGRRYEIDTTSLGDSTRAELVAAVNRARDEEHREPGSTARDLRSYEIRIADDDREAAIVVYDGSIPPATRQLIDLITSLRNRASSR